jgi:hypothetical protein
MRCPYLALSFALTSTLLTAQGPNTWPIKEAPAALRPAIARADLMIATMHDSVLRELADTFEAGGADKAILSCHIESTFVAQRLGREGIAAGRTSDRLRDPTNAPRPWATDLVKANAGRMTRDVEGFAVDLGDKVGVLLPISHRPICANCHGPADGLSAGVRRELKDRYPVDKALGFKVGEIRGWYWLEMPKHPR